MKKSVAVLIIITVFTKILGFLREVSLSYFYGVSNISDAYLISLTIPSFIFGFIGLGLSTAYIPMFNNVRARVGHKEGIRFTNNVINSLMLLITIVLIIGLIFTNQIIRVFAYGFDDQTFNLAVRFTRISLVGMYFTGLVSIFTGFLQIKRKYIIPVIGAIPLNIITVLAIYISSKGNLVLLSVGSVIALGSQLLLIIPFAIKSGYRYSNRLELRDSDLNKMLLIALPVILGSSIGQINLLVDRTIASGITVGGISALNYASKLNSFVYAIIVTPLISILYPVISKYASENNYLQLKESLAESIRIMIILALPATIGVMVFSEEIVRLLFGRGEFDLNAVSLTSYALFFYLMSLIALAIRDLLSRAFYAIGNTLSPTVNSMIGLSLNIVLNILLSRYMGVGGLALATSISLFVSCILMIYALRKKIGSFGMKQISISFLMTKNSISFFGYGRTSQAEL